MSLDRTNRRLTGFLGLTMAAVLAVQIVLCRGPVAWIPWLTGTLLTMILGPAFAMAPKAADVDVEGAELRVCRRLWKPLRIAFADLERVEPGPATTLSNAVRLLGVGPFFGTFGLLHVIGFGRVRGYLTRSGPTLLLRRTGDALPVLLTPDDPAAFTAALQAAGVTAVAP
jgi:hypothetical protein